MQHTLGRSHNRREYHKEDRKHIGSFDNVLLFNNRKSAPHLKHQHAHQRTLLRLYMAVRPITRTKLH